MTNLFTNGYKSEADTQAHRSFSNYDRQVLLQGSGPCVTGITSPIPSRLAFFPYSYFWSLSLKFALLAWIPHVPVCLLPWCRSFLPRRGSECDAVCGHHRAGAVLRYTITQRCYRKGSLPYFFFFLHPSLFFRFVLFLVICVKCIGIFTCVNISYWNTCISLILRC